MSKGTYYSQACYSVLGFQQMSEEFIRKLVINGKSRSTHQNYVRQMSKLALYYGRSPLELDIDELEEYLYYLIQRDTDALSSYKHLVYGLRKLFQLFGKDELSLSLPKIDCPNKLPVVLSRQEVKQLLKTPVLIREKIMFGLTYDTGMRISELVSLQIRDVDMHRATVHIGQPKNKKNRYVPISSHAVRGVKKHITINNPKTYLFENEWVVYAKRPFGGPKQVINYLGRYTHRTAISNDRILNVTNSQVTFSWKDYSNNYARKNTTLKGEDFLRLFCQHILPPGFTRIRHYGFLSSASKTKALSLIRKALNPTWL